MGKRLLQNLGPSLILFIVVLVFRFKFHFDPLSASLFWLLFFGVGGILGTYISKIEEVVSVKLETNPHIFHTFLFQVVFAVLTFYVLTSTGSAMASGVSLFAYLQLLKDQVRDKTAKNMNSWGGFFGLVVPEKFQSYWVGGGILILLYFVYILVR